MDFRSACCLGLLLSSRFVQADGLQSVADEVGAIAGLPSLETAALPAGAVELRIWTGFGVVVPNHMLRLRRSADGEVTGERLRYFPVDLSYLNAQAAAFRKDARRGCEQLQRGETTEVCVLVRRPWRGWRRIYESLHKLGIATLPDGSLLPPPRLELNDGYSIHVEVRQGADYRTYSYINPVVIDAPEARAVLRISDIVERALR